MFFVPTSGLNDWKKLLADPEKHLREGYSAYALASRWQAAGGLNIANDCDRALRYQLVHRTASAILEAKRFHTRKAVMLVHSFSAHQDGFVDFQAFAAQLRATIPGPGELYGAGIKSGVELFLGWVQGPLPQA